MAKTPAEIAAALQGRERKNIESAAGAVLENTLGKYLHEVISSGAEPSRAGLRAWAQERVAQGGLTASWFEAVVQLVDGSAENFSR